MIFIIRIYVLLLCLMNDRLVIAKITIIIRIIIISWRISVLWLDSLSMIELINIFRFWLFVAHNWIFWESLIIIISWIRSYMVTLLDIISIHITPWSTIMIIVFIIICWYLLHLLCTSITQSDDLWLINLLGLLCSMVNWLVRILSNHLHFIFSRSISWMVSFTRLVICTNSLIWSIRPLLLLCSIVKSLIQYKLVGFILDIKLFWFNNGPSERTLLIIIIIN